MKTRYQDEIVLTLFDLKRFFSRKLSFVFKLSLTCALGVLIFSLLTPLKYKQEAKLRTLANTQQAAGRIKELFPQLSIMSGTEDLIALLRSKKLTGQVIEKLGLQALCEERSFFEKYKARFKENLLHGAGIQSAFDRDAFAFRDVIFVADQKLQLFLRCREDGFYELLDAQHNLVGQAKLGSVINAPWGCITLCHAPFSADVDKLYPLVLSPLSDVMGFWLKKLKTFPSKLDKLIVELELVHSDRSVGAQFLNALMRSYLDFSKREQEALYEKQINYLEKKTQDLATNYNDALLQHSKYMERALEEYGTLGYSEDVKLLSGPKNLYTSKLLDVEVELKKLGNVDATAHLAQKQSALSDFVLSHLELETKQRDLSLNKKELARDVSASPIDYHTLQTLSIVKNAAQERTSFPLKPKGVSSSEFTGLSASEASKVLADYIKQRDLLQEQINELIFLKEHIADSYFEVTSLGSVFEGRLARDLATRASAVALQLQDTGGFGSREQEELLQTIASHKGFLSQYLSQTIGLKTLKFNLLVEKIASLQLSLQEVLKMEQVVVKEKLSDLKKLMKRLPDRWYQESILNLRQEQMGTMLKGFEQLVGSLNVGMRTNDAGVQILDPPIIPHKTISPLFWMRSLSAFVILLCLSYGLYFIKEIYRGFPVSEEMLKTLKLPVVGSFSKDSERNRDLLRDCLASLDGEKERVLALITGGYLDYAQQLASLLSKRGQSALVISYCFDKEGNFTPFKADQDVDQLPIERRKGYDEWVIRGDYEVEDFCSPSFQQIVESLKGRYQRILLSMPFDPARAEGRVAATLADCAFVSVQKEKKEDLLPYLEQKSSVQFICVSESL